jgi:hypothetical protein
MGIKIVIPEISFKKEKFSSVELATQGMTQGKIKVEVRVINPLKPSGYYLYHQF